jgi:hypothetical protein
MLGRRSAVSFPHKGAEIIMMIAANDELMRIRRVLLFV